MYLVNMRTVLFVLIAFVVALGLVFSDAPICVHIRSYAATRVNYIVNGQVDQAINQSNNSNNNGTNR